MNAEINDNDRRFMQMACELAYANVEKGGGPFGAVIVKDGEVVAAGTNTVTLDNDPTAHAEVNAIRNACRKTGNFKLEGCDIYTSCEPCPMCLGAIYWAHLDHIYYGNNKADAARIGFDDSFIYEELSLERDRRHKPMTELLPHEAKAAFRAWEEKADKQAY